MAVKALALFLFSLSSVCCFSQNIRLDVFDITGSGSSLQIENRTVVDSLYTVEDQPSFHPTEPLLVFVAKAGNEFEVRTYNYLTRETKGLLKSKDPIKLPQITPDLKFISYLRSVGGKFHLVKRSLKEGTESTINTTLALSGYCWIDDNSMLATVDGNPNTLQLVTIRPFKSMVVAQHVSNVIQKNKQHFVFLHKLSVASWSMKRVDQSGKIEIVASAVPDSEVYALTPEGSVLQIDGENRLALLSGSQAPKPIASAVWPDDRMFLSIGVSGDGKKLFVLSKEFTE